MKKKIIAFTAVIIVALFVVIAFNYKPIYYRLYPLDRITGTYSIKLNHGRITCSEPYYEYGGNDNKIKLENAAENFKIRAGKYGSYKIGFVIHSNDLYRITNDPYFLGKDDIDLSVVYFNTNWWHITNIDIEIDIREENDEWYAFYVIAFTEPTEEGNIVSNTVSQNVKLDALEDTKIIFGI